jgi:hypothetical protein
MEQHAARVACAEELLPAIPITAHGVERLISEAREATGGFIQPELMAWLPDARRYFSFLE